MPKRLLCAIDGPNGVGKSALQAALAERLRARRLSVVITREPSDTELGRLVRRLEPTYRGLTYACLIAADRYHHLETEIVPALSAGAIVLSDRYLASSLALQSLSGVPMDFCWKLHSNCVMPDVSIDLTAPAAVLQERLSHRSQLSWLERTYTAQQEIEAYATAAAYMRAHGLEVLTLDTNERDLQRVADIALSHLTSTLEQGHHHGR